MIWKCRDFRIALDRTLVMAIVNVTPDSFSDGGMYFSPEEAVARARNCLADGADIIDIGGESTRPGATPLEWKDEWERIEPVVASLAAAKGTTRGGKRNVRASRRAPISIDTYHPETARRAIAAGADIINCVYADAVGEMAGIARETGCGLVVPFRPETGMSAYPAGCEDLKEQVLIDPMIGFGTTREEDMALLRDVGRMAAIAPVLAGVSRKRIIKRLTGEKCPGKNLGGSIGAAVWCAMAGASVVRVHDVRDTVQALAVVNALSAAGKTEVSE